METLRRMRARPVRVFRQDEVFPLQPQRFLGPHASQGFQDEEGFVAVLLFGARPEEVPELGDGEGLTLFLGPGAAGGLGVSGDVVGDEALLDGPLERDADRGMDVADDARAEAVEHLSSVEAVEVLGGKVL